MVLLVFIKDMQKIKIIDTKTVVKRPSVYHFITFSLKIDDIPNWDVIKHIHEIKSYVEKHNIIDGCIKFKVKGIATCMGQDKWEETKGRHIAITKAQMKLHKKLDYFYKGIWKLLDNLSENIWQHCQRHWDKFIQCDKHLENDVFNEDDRKLLGYELYN